MAEVWKNTEEGTGGDGEGSHQMLLWEIIQNLIYGFVD